MHRPVCKRVATQITVAASPLLSQACKGNNQTNSTGLQVELTGESFLKKDNAGVGSMTWLHHFAGTIVNVNRFLAQQNLLGSPKILWRMILLIKTVREIPLLSSTKCGPIMSLPTILHQMVVQILCSNLSITLSGCCKPRKHVICLVMKLLRCTCDSSKTSYLSENQVPHSTLLTSQRSTELYLVFTVQRLPSLYTIGETINFLNILLNYV